MTRARDLADGADKDITGTLTVDGLTVDGAASAQTFSADHTTPIVDFMESDATNLNMRLLNNAGDFYLRTINDAKTSGTYRVKVGNSTGDISFFADDGTTQALFFDASTQRLGLGTTSPDRAAHIVSTALKVSRFESTASTKGHIDFENDGTTNQPSLGSVGDNLTFETSFTERLRIDSSGNVGIGNTSPETILHATASSAIIRLTSDANGTSGVDFGDSADTNIGRLLYDNSDNSMRLTTNASERMRIDSSGNVGINTTSPVLKFNVDTGDMVLSRTTNGDGNELGEFMFWNRTNAGSGTGTTFVNDVASMQGKMVGTGNNSGGSLHFYTKADAGDKTERMTIDGSGNVGIGTTSDPKSTSGSAPRGQWLQGANGAFVSATYQTSSAIFNRLNNDGVVVSIRQNGSQEGTISVSGTTVSYNGGHLSRWSQATDGNRIDGLVKGTVMTNLDQMAEWTKDGVTEDNEQLNCMAVSSVEGDANVAGVFVNWDDDDTDYTADMNVAMTGDMVIRIANGTTVARGDLLMSAGDGTAKPQGDDIVRSKTIAKVTSTNVSHTYDDGSYLVPCVLMAC